MHASTNIFSTHHNWEELEIQIGVCHFASQRTRSVELKNEKFAKESVVTRTYIQTKHFIRTFVRYFFLFLFSRFLVTCSISISEFLQLWRNTSTKRQRERQLPTASKSFGRSLDYHHKSVTDWLRRVSWRNFSSHHQRLMWWRSRIMFERLQTGFPSAFTNTALNLLSFAKETADSIHQSFPIRTKHGWDLNCPTFTRRSSV